MYTIGQVSEMVGLPISTLRYYDKEGLFPGMRRASGIRRFGEKEIDAIRVIECLKKSGLEIKDIKLFMEWCAQGSETYPRRLELFIKQKAAVEMEIERMTFGQVLYGNISHRGKPLSLHSYSEYIIAQYPRILER